MALAYQVAMKERKQLVAELEEASQRVAKAASIVLAWDEREGSVPMVAMRDLRETVQAYQVAASALTGRPEDAS